MIIEWLGLSSFIITTKTALGEHTLLIDPPQSQDGFKLPRGFTPDLVIVGRPQAAAGEFGNDTFILNTPGEVEVKEIFVYGIPLASAEGKTPTIPFRIETENMTLAHLGWMSKKPTTEEMHLLRDPDILMIPVGGKDVLDAEDAAALIGELQPRVIIPMLYTPTGAKGSFATVDAFVKEAGAKRLEVDGSRFRVTKKNLPEEETQLAILSPR